MKQVLIVMFYFELTVDCFGGSYLVDKYTNYESEQTEHYNKIENDIYKKWHEVATSSNKMLVNYYQQNNIRLMIDYENGTAVIEGIDTSAADLKIALNDVISDTESTSAILNLADLVKNSVKSKTKFINELAITEITNAKNKLKINFSFLSDHIKRRAERLRPLVEKWSLKNQIEPSLVMAVIRQESAFNPRATSPIPAFGLMQIVPKYAGRDVMMQMNRKDTIPSREELFEPERNIMFGTSYLKILQNKFKRVTEDANQLQDLVVASYNWGPERISNALRKNRLVLSEPDLQGQINKIAPKETINYLQKVKSFKAEFQNME